MSQTAYERLADALDGLPNGFPRTSSGVEIRLLEKIFSPDEARLASHLTGQMEPVDAIARRAGMPARDAGRELVALTKRGIIWSGKAGREVAFIVKEGGEHQQKREGGGQKPPVLDPRPGEDEGGEEEEQGR